MGLQKGRIRFIWKLSAFCMALVMLFLFGGCKKTPEDLFFTNHTGTRIDNIYFCPPDAEHWGVPATRIYVADNFSVGFSLEKIGGPGVYDIGTINVDGRCFDVFEVALAEGDSIDLGPETPMGEFGIVTLTVTHADWTETTYTGYAYYEWQLETMIRG